MNKSEQTDKAAQGIAELIVAEAKDAGGELARATYHLHLLVRAKVLELVREIRAE